MAQGDTYIGEFEKKTLGWVMEATKTGLSLLKRERAYTECHQAMEYINGSQFPLRTRAISRITDNRLRKIVQETVSALTEVRQIWDYVSNDNKYKAQGELLNKLARAWWKNSQADRKLQNTLTYSCAGGSGYAYLRWNPDLPGGGDIEVVVFDPRDVVPIDPTYTDSIQDWRGVILRQRVSGQDLRRKYPNKAYVIGQNHGTWFGPLEREGSKLYSVVSTVWNILTKEAEGTERKNPDLVDLLHIFVKDDSINTGDQPMVMGEPGSEYTVYPVGHIITEKDGSTRQATVEDARLYPRGRMIICTMDCILKDGPNPYWHGMFPVIKFTIDPIPWTILGGSMVGDLIPLQNALNETLRGLEDAIGQWIRRGVVADKTAISKATLDAIDTRKSGLKAYVNPSAGGKGFEIVDGPQLPPWYIQMLQYYKDEMDELSGVRGLQQLAQLKQMPSADTLDRYMESLSPLLKLRARSIEISLCELAEQLKVNFFQYYTASRRMQILGPDGLQMEDFDYDPGTLVPSSLPGDSPAERAQHHHRNFTFQIAANSFLEVSHTTQKMLYLQLFRGNALDPWTLWESMNVPNLGQIPEKSVPERIVLSRQLGLMQGPTPEMVQAQQQSQTMQAQMMMMQMQMQMQQMQAQAGQQGFEANQPGQESQAGPGGAPPAQGGGFPGAGG